MSNDLFNFISNIISLMHDHKYSLTELENMMPWEREVYIGMLFAHLKKKEDQQG